MISLFSGAMGLDLGLESVGFRAAVTVEKSSIAVQTITLNKGTGFPIIAQPIEDVRSTDILKAAGLKRRETVVLTGGPCCQSFSTVGKRRSLSDPKRGVLFRHFKRIVLETQPRFFVMENVKGMLSAAIRHRPLDQRGPGFPPLARHEEFGSALKVILRELAELNYYVIFGLVNCADYGVPQKRQRVVFIGSRDGEDIVLPETTHQERGNKAKLAWVTLKEAIAELNEESPEFTPFAPDRAKLMARLKAGENWMNLPKALHRVALGGAADTWGGRSGFCRRLSWSEPSPTLTTDPKGRATTLCHPVKLRPLSVREYARLQQFPDSWRFAGTVSQRYEQNGNAVPLGLGTAIGQMLLTTIELTHRRGLPDNAASRLGKVICTDKSLEGRLKHRRRTQLHPAWKRKNSGRAATKKWLASVGTR